MSFSLKMIGKLPEEWEIVLLEELLVENPRNGIYKTKEFHGRGIKIVNMGEMFGYDFISNQDMKFVELNAYEKERFLLREGDLLFARRSLTAEGAGKSSIIENLVEEMTFESSIIRIRLDNKKTHPKFYYYYFRSRQGKHSISSILRQTAVAGITGKDLIKLEVPVPSLNEQKAIINILTKLDEKIEVNNRIIKTLENMARRIFKQWIVEFEFPNEDGESYKSSGGEMVESELGMIPNGWVVKGLDDIADYINGLAMQKFRPEENESSYPVLKIRELRKGATDSDSDICSRNIEKRYIVKDGDIIFSWSGSLLVDIWCGGFCGLNQHLFKVTSDEYDKWFYYYWTNYHLERFISIAESKATTMGHIKRKDLTDSKVIVPSDDILIKVTSVLEPMLDKLTESKIESRRLVELRDSLLLKLMSGEIRVPLESRGEVS